MNLAVISITSKMNFRRHIYFDESIKNLDSTLLFIQSFEYNNHDKPDSCLQDRNLRYLNIKPCHGLGHLNQIWITHKTVLGKRLAPAAAQKNANYK